MVISKSGLTFTQNSNYNVFATKSESSKNNYNPAFGESLHPVQKLSHLLDFKRNIKVLNDTFGLVACTTSVIGFGVGGPALIYDYYYKKHHKKEGDDQKPKEYGHFKSETKIGKVGLAMSQAALTVSGFAGATTGFSVGVPLMAAGEFIGNVIAAPVINTPTGYGLLNIGLAAVFGGRAFDTDPSHKAKMSVFMSKNGIWNKTKYVAGNMKTCLGGAAHLSIELGKHIGGLFSFNKTTRQNAKDFFHYKIFRVKSSTIGFVQNVNANGMVHKVEPKLQGNSSLLLVASSLLALTGVFVIATEALKKLGIIKSDKPTKAGFTAGKIGQVFDNMGIVTYGMERCYKGNVTAGVPTIISGATMIAGAPNADNDFGKGLTWAGLSAFFLFLAAERFQDFSKARKSLKTVADYLKAAATGNEGIMNTLKTNEDTKAVFEEAAVFGRQFEIDLSKVLKNNKNKRLDNLRKALGDKNEDTYITLRKWINKNYKGKNEKTPEELMKIGNAGLKADEDEAIQQLPEFIEFVKNKLGAVKEGELLKQYNSAYGIDKLKADIEARFPNTGFADSIQCHEVKLEAAIREAIYSNILKSGSHYSANLEKLIASQDPIVSQVAKDCKKDYTKLLQEV